MRRKRILNILIMSLLLLSVITPVVFYQTPEIKATTSTTQIPTVEYGRYNISDYRLLIIVLDGVKFDHVNSKYMPFIADYLKPRSLWIWGYTLLQSVTRPYRALLASGAVPWFTGIDTNDRTSIWTGLKTIVDEVHDMGYTTVAVIDGTGYAFFTSEDDAVWTTGYKASWSDYIVFGGLYSSDQPPSLVANYTLDMMDTHPDWKLLWVEMHAPDTVGHREGGWESGNYTRMVTESDAAVRRIYEGLEERGILNETIILITTDHGGHDITHGDVIEYDMRIWGLIHTPDEAIVGEYEYASPIDLTATVAYLMGIPLSEYAVGTTLAGGAEVSYNVVNILNTDPTHTTPVKLPNGTSVNADHLVIGNGYYTLLFTLLNDTTYSHDLGAVTYGYLVATPTTGHQFVGYAGGSGANPTRSDLINKNLPDRLNTIYTSATNYYPTVFALLDESSGDLSGVGRVITGSDFGNGVTNPSNDLVERNLTIEKYGNATVLKYYAKTINAGFTGSYSMEVNIATYVIPNTPFIIHEVNITNLDSVNIEGYNIGIRASVETAYHSQNFVFLGDSGDIVNEVTGLTTPTLYDGYRGTAVLYKDADTNHERVVRGFFLLSYDNGTPRVKVGGSTLNIMLSNVTISPSQSFRYVIVEFSSFSRDDITEIVKLTKMLWSYIENHGANVLQNMFLKASPLIAVRYGNESSYPIHIVADWGYDPVNSTVRAVVYAPSGEWSTIEIQVPSNTSAVESVVCNATDYNWYFDKVRGVLVVKVLHSSPVEVVVTFTKKLYSIPVRIIERSGSDLTDYAVRIELNATNFLAWGATSSGNGSDIYFIDEDGNPLYYWIESFDVVNKEALIWVKVPSLPANSEKTVYMYFGADNPYAEYNNPEEVFDFYDNFEGDSLDTTKWDTSLAGTSTITLQNGVIILDSGGKGSVGAILAKYPTGTGYVVETRAYDLNYYTPRNIWVNYLMVSSTVGRRAGMGLGADMYGINEVDYSTVTTTWVYSVSKALDDNDMYRITVKTHLNNVIEVSIYDETTATEVATFTYTETSSGTYQYGISLSENILVVDYFIIRKFVDPEPKVTLGWVDSLSEGRTYYAPITITNLMNQDITDYQVRLVLNSTNFNGWSYVTYTDGYDIYFIDEDGNPLYYWIESFDVVNKEALIWVKVPSLPANSEKTVYMYFGAYANPYYSYMDISKVFIRIIDNLVGAWTFEEGSGVVVHDMSGNGYHGTIYGGATWVDTGDPRLGYALSFNGKDAYVSIGDFFSAPSSLSIFAWVNIRNFTESPILVKGIGQKGNREYELSVTDGKVRGVVARESTDTVIVVDSATSVPAGTWVFVGTTWDGSVLKVYYNGTEDGSTTAQITIEDLSAPIEIGKDQTPDYANATIAEVLLFSDPLTQEEALDLYNNIAYITLSYPNNVLVRKYVLVEPSVTIGSVKRPLATYALPPESLILVHSIAYMPNASQFNHTFTAIDTSTAGYEIDYTTPYGWRVYADPYDSTKNNATLISEVNITLPYSKVIVENVTLYAKRNATGSYSKLWIKVLDQNNSVIAEYINTSLDTNWTKIIIPINTNISGQINLWINATVESSTTVGEELAIKDVKVFVKHESYIDFKVAWEANVEYFNCTATFTVELASTEYLNTSVITFKLIEYLIYNGTDYPIQPILIGNETIGLHNYSVYRIDPANYAQTTKIYAFLENKLKSLKALRDTVLVGEPLTIDLPDIGNVTIVELNVTYTNVTSVTLKFDTIGTFTIRANITRVPLWRLGYAIKTITVKYGVLSARILDADSKGIDYEDIVFQLVDKTSGSVVEEFTNVWQIDMTQLRAGSYILRVKFKDLIVAQKDFELNITTDGSAIDLICPMKRLSIDYRGFARTVATNYDKEIVSVENMSTKFPYSKMKILLNGTGSFKLYVNYQEDPPTKVSVAVSNITDLKYYWSGNYLVIEGVLGSIGEINIADLYKVRLEIYDRLGNPMPEWIYATINKTQLFGSIIEHLLYPETHPIELPEEINGFEFYSYFDGYNETVRNITINNTDVLYKVWYRIPTKIETVKAFQVTASWFERFLKPFISSDENTTKVYIEGYLRDYYDNGVPNRPLIVNITDVQANFTWSVNTTTDPSGYFRTPLLDLIRGRTYEIKIIYNGDSIYVGTLTTTELTPETLPEAPAPITEIIPINYIILGIGALVIVGAIVGIIRAIKHTIEDIRETKRFIRRRR